ncbi:hypothetical protein J5W78_00330 [Akkermansia massiliensis]|uniref:hypothetical protein n=1 Tax=Akkermansia massiliensis TaxID=2927224 RepID=UPI001C05F097|nr:hypothetical protein [Akkermansia massiliensis]QWP48766.1 hypothetical protein J5W78_00330 [Akkermansia massiliensis]
MVAANPRSRYQPEAAKSTLTLAPNTTGQPRQVWVFVGHHYAQTAVVEINH